MAEMSRLELTKKIQEIDRELGKEIATTQGRSRHIDPRDFHFPWVSVIITLATFGFWMFGGAILPGIHGPYAFYIFIAACVFALISLWRIFRWLKNGVFGKSKPLMSGDESDRARQLRMERDALRAQLEEIKRKEEHGGV
ncbi:MAG: hypothetical protein RLY93_19380 [Sumerlaeia bacterium]